MSKTAISLLISAILFFITTTAPRAQQLSDHQKDSLLNNRLVIPGTDISMIPPAYFKPFVNDGHFGFMHEGAASSISVEQIPGTAFSIVVSGITPENMAAQNIAYKTREDLLTYQGHEACLFTVGFMVKSRDGSRELEYERLMFFTGNYNRTIWINASYPLIARNVLYNVLRESLLSVQFPND